MQVKGNKVAARSYGANNLSAKNINEKKYLNKVTGMALTAAQKKKLLKKQMREQAREESDDASDGGVEDVSIEEDN